MSLVGVTQFNKEGQRHLYVPGRSVSREAQVERGYKLIAQGYSVWVHAHGYQASCKRSDNPNEGCVELSLTPTPDSPSVLHVSDTESTPTESA